MEQPTEPAETPTTHKKELVVGVAVVLVILAAIAAIALFVYNSGPKIVYQPVEACDLFTPAEARDLIGGQVIGANAKKPVISDNVATSKCSYTDDNIDGNKMIVAAVAVRSGINDKGVQQNKTEFSSGRPSKNTEDVKGVGEKAYFNKELGQLNVLDGRKWIILSYGVGSTPQANTVEKAKQLAEKVLR